ncbi:MAG: Cof-type HAD-IIB family hydrolase [Phycisphaerae bacterium]|nr:Cof-type HAD-IIB family hydrolase [Phycisphaerae bacterium]
MPYKLLALDLDGTLFDSKGEIPALNVDAVARAKEAGILVTLCTGRGRCETQAAIDALEHKGPVVLAGGAMVSDPTTGRTLHRATIEPMLTRRIIDLLDPATHAVLVLLDPEPREDDYLIVGRENLTDNTHWWFGETGARIHYADQPSEADLHHALRVGIVGPERVMAESQDRLLAELGDQVLIQHFVAVTQKDGEDVHILEVFASGVTKWSALQWVAAEHDIAESEVAAIGDHINDLSMIEHAACGIAMANAVHPVRNIADRITTTNNDCGVAAAIDNLLNGDW